MRACEEAFAGGSECFVEAVAPWLPVGVGAAQEVREIFDVVFAEVA